MIGNLLSKAFKIVTIPITTVSVGIDIATGGDGSKGSRIDVPLTGDLENLRDRIADSIEEIDG